MNGKSFIEHCNGVQDPSNQRPHLLIKERALSNSLTHVLVLTPYFKVQHIEPEEYPVEVLSNSLQMRAIMH